MREIKFRAWLADPSEPYDGVMFENVGFMPPDEFNCDGDWIDTQDGCLIAPEQSTGLRDKNGKEIYEGDILGWIAFGCPMDEFEELQRTYRLEVKWSCGGFDIPYANDTETTYEVIGNIHENHELLA